METTAYRPSLESRAFDFDQVTTSPQPSYSFGRGDANDISRHDPIPLFLSDPEGEPEPEEFVPVRTKSSIVPRILGGILAAAAIAFLVTLFQSDIARMFVVNAKASIEGAATEQVAAAPVAPPPVVRPTPLKDPARVSNPMLAHAEATDLAPPRPTTPSREAIATAYQSALQAQTPFTVISPAPAAAPVPSAATAPAPALPAAPPAARTLDADTLAGLMTRAKSMLAVGDIASARLLLERAAHAADANAAFMLAQTYDPAVLGTNDTRSITADPAAARSWYQKAAQLGSADARQRLTQLQN